MTRFNTRKMTILVQDPSVRIAGRLVFAQIDLPYEDLAPGPVGYRVRVADFDASANALYAPFHPVPDRDGVPQDKYAYTGADTDAKACKAWENQLLADPAFHAQNVYAIVMRTLGLFEFALGRRVAWGFEGHQLYVAPHAFLEANAFYSEEDISTRPGPTSASSPACRTTSLRTKPRMRCWTAYAMVSPPHRRRTRLPSTKVSPM